MNNISFTKVKKSISCAKTEQELKTERHDFMIKLFNLLNVGKDTLYTQNRSSQDLGGQSLDDRTSRINLWLNISSDSHQNLKNPL